jgi:hypothetical protein
MTEWRVAIDGDEIPAVYEEAASSAPIALAVLAHGAGGSMSDRSMLAAASALRRHGISVVRYNFLYKEKGSGRPDPMPKLMATVAAVVDHTRRELAPLGVPLIIGGRSMGGRAASMLAAEGFEADGLLLLAYPLHPAGKPEQLRDAHLSRIAMPILAFSGTRDALCTRELMERVLENLDAHRSPPIAHREWVWLQGADHSFHVLKSSGRTDADVLEEVGEKTAVWASRLKR